jgi:hypothetical protein
MISADNTHLVELALKATGMIQNQLVALHGDFDRLSLGSE